MQTDNNNIVNKEWLWVTFIFIFFIALRIFSLTHATVFEDHDSLRYLDVAKLIKNGRWDQIELGSISYTGLIAILYNFGIGLELGGRLISLIFSIVLFFSVYFISKKISDIKTALITILILSFTPYLINLSVFVLTESSYIGIVYLGVCLLWYHLEKPGYLRFLFIGIVFGLAFTVRPEGIVFVVLIPVIQSICFYLWNKKLVPNAKKLSLIVLVVIGFLGLALPVIINESNYMGTLSIDERTAWEKLLKIPDGKSYDAKTYGLDFSPDTINVDYVVTHPEVFKKYDLKESPHHNIKFFFNNLKDLDKFQLSSLVGIFVIFFLGIGLVDLFIKRKFKDIFLIISFGTIFLLIPLIWLKTFETRHIAVAAPLLIIVAGIGLKYSSDTVENWLKEKRFGFLLKDKVHLVLIGVMIFITLSSLNDSLRHPTFNSAYSAGEFNEAIYALKNDINKNKISDPMVVARKLYFPFYAGVDGIEIPFTDYNGLINYCKLRKANYVYLNSKELKTFPFLQVFDENKAADFDLIYEKTVNDNKKIELYRFDPSHNK